MDSAEALGLAAGVGVPAAGELVGDACDWLCSGTQPETITTRAASRAADPDIRLTVMERITGERESRRMVTRARWRPAAFRKSPWRLSPAGPSGHPPCAAAPFARRSGPSAPQPGRPRTGPLAPRPGHRAY